MSDMAIAELTPRKITVDEYHRMVDARIIEPDERVELLDGLIVEMSPIGKPHWLLHWQIDSFLKERLGTRAAVVGHASLPLGAYSEPQPDIIVFARSAVEDSVRIPTVDEVYAFVEISDSSLTKDKGPKRDLYEGFGIKDYLVVDVAKDRVFHYAAHHGGRYGEPRTMTYGDTFALAALPDIVLEADRFLPPLAR